MTNQSTSVLIVGGALTGLSAATFLAWQGVSCVVVERHPDLLIHPRLRGLTHRAMETLRQVGLEPAIRAASYADGSQLAFVPLRAETLSDPEYLPVQEPQDGEADDMFASMAAHTPTVYGMVDQDKVEILLRDRARELGADIRFDTELLSFDAGDDGVTAVVRDRRTGTESTIRADYLIGADGANSPVRRSLEIESDGPGMLYTTVTALVDADLTSVLAGRSVGIAYLREPQPFTVMMQHDEAGRQWIFGTGYDPETESVDDFTDDRVVDMVRAAAGVPDLDVRLRPQIPGTKTKVLGFPIGARVARNYRAGRVFVAGDAARINPPTGGLGGSTGIQDAHNLAWKLAAVLKGYAGPGLLDTYDDERRPNGVLTMEQAFARFGDRMTSGAQVQLLDHSAVSMGYQYRSAAVLGADDDGSPLHPSELSGQPGRRAPHVALEDLESTIDLYGKGFVLLTGSKGDVWLSAAGAVAGQLSVPLEAYQLPDTDSERRHGLAESGALLVRPDGFVAWRTATTAADEPSTELGQALRAVLSKS